MASIFGKDPKQVIINYKAHSGQEEISEAIRANAQKVELSATVIEIICGRGWGKTLYLVCDVLIPFLDDNANARVMWVAPNYMTAMSAIDDVFKGSNELTGERYVPEFDYEGNRIWEFVTTKSGPVLKWYNGAMVFFRSADAPDSIVSKGFNLIIIDEAALIEEKVFTQQILGTARKAGIRIFMITTPRGKRHWTYKLFLKGQDEKETSYLSFQQPFTRNPYHSKSLLQIIKDIPDWLYRQEYLAEFIEDGEGVFRGIENILSGEYISYPSQQQEWEKPIEPITVKGIEKDYKIEAEDRRFVVGLDIAKSIDYTVLTAMCLDTGDIVYYRRFNKTDYREVLKITEKVCAKYNQAELIFDATGVGSGLADMFNNYNVAAHPFVFTNDSKNDIINKLALAIEHQEIHIPNIQTIINELSVYTYTLTRTNKISYNAPAGFHDDIVISIALSNWYRKENVGNGELGIVDDILAANEPRPPRNSFEDFIMNDND